MTISIDFLLSLTMIPFIDIHTHFRNNKPDVIPVLNIAQKDHLFHNRDSLSWAPHSTYFSAGLHPWFLNTNNFEADFSTLSELMKCPQVIAVGECGLDRLKGVDLAFQTHVFEAHIRLAESLSKPVVIHCVKAFNELVAIKKRLKPHIPLIVHGFNQNQTILTDLIKNDFYISIGAKVVYSNSPAAAAVQWIPTERLFLETDDIEMNIMTVYERVAELKGLDLAVLKSNMVDNFNRILTPKILN